MTNEGFKNENRILKALNDKKFLELNNNMKQLVLDIYEKEISLETFIKAYKKGGSHKTDLIVDVNGEEFNLSIKRGTGNSVHQEKLEEFISFLKTEYDISEELSNDIRFFIWGDGTYDGTGDVSDRLNSSQLKKLYPEVIENIRLFLHSNKRDLIERFVIMGPKSLSKPDFMYYGTEEDGLTVKSSYVLDWLADDENEKTTAPLPVGRLTFQAWNRNINGGDKSESKRGEIQLKWGSVGKDIESIYNENKRMRNRGTAEGTEEEISFVKLLNKKEDLSYWDVLKLDPENHFAIHVLYHKFGKINNKKVKPKADVYIAKGNVPQEYLENNDFYLNEDDIEPFNLEPVDFTGISVKMRTSTNYQITKMGPNTFNSIFGSYELGAGASIYCSKEKDLEKNEKVINGWKSNKDDFINYFKDYDVITDSELGIDSAKKIKKFSNQKIEEIINENSDVSKFIFQGIGNFEEPFTVHYLYENNELKDSCFIPFKPTTGSGRSRGDFTIVIKPKGR